MKEAYIVTGRLTDDRTVVLDEPLPAAGKLVKLVIEVEPGQTPARASMAEFAARLLESQRTNPRTPMSRAEMHALMHGDPMQDYEE
jgi:hypothetical protein